MPVAQLTDRAVLRISAADARAYLQDLLTNDIAALAPGKPQWAGLLSAQGKLLFDMILHDTGSAMLADVRASDADALAKRLTMYRLRRAVAIEATDLPVFARWGEAAVPDAHPLDPRLPALGERWIGNGARPVPTATLADYHRHRLALGVPDSDDMLPDKLMWLEANAVELNGVSFTKGCYVGQENTARMHHRDRLRKRLLPVGFAGDPGDGVILAGAVAAGELRSHGAVGDTSSGPSRGIAYLKLEPVEAGTPLTLNGGALTVDWPGWLPTRPPEPLPA